MCAWLPLNWRRYKCSAQNRHTPFPSQTGGLPPASEVQILWAGAAAVNCCLVLLCFPSRNDTRYCSITVAVYIKIKIDEISSWPGCWKLED